MPAAYFQKDPYMLGGWLITGRSRSRTPRRGGIDLDRRGKPALITIRIK